MSWNITETLPMADSPPNRSTPTPSRSNLPPALTYSSAVSDEFDWDVKIPLIVLGILVAVWDLVALVSIYHAKRTPHIVRFLSSALISFEILSLTAFTVRKLLLDASSNDVALVIGSHFVLLSYITIGLMSAERLVLFTSNRIYIQHIHLKTFQRISVAIWSTLSFAYYISIYVVCNMTDYVVCRHNMKVTFGFILFAVVIISTSCYLRIFTLLRYQRIAPVTGINSIQNTSMQKLRTTHLMFMFLAVTLIGFLLFVADVIFEPSQKIKRLELDIFNLFNCAIDPLLHVWWFRECRMQLLKRTAMCFPSVQKRVEQMKIDLFDIVTYKTGGTAEH